MSEYKRLRSNSLVSPPRLRSRRRAQVLPVFLTYLFLTISVSPIISTSTGQIFTKFAEFVELRTLTNDLRLGFFRPSDVAEETNFC